MPAACRRMPCMAMPHSRLANLLPCPPTLLKASQLPHLPWDLCLLPCRLTKVRLRWVDVDTCRVLATLQILPGETQEVC